MCAAGTSTRMGSHAGKKEYRPLPGRVDGLTVLGAAVLAFAAIPEIQTIVITVPVAAGAEADEARKALPPELLAGENGAKIHFVPGGATRQASVWNALSALEKIQPPDFVLIHDGARPFVSPSLIMRIIAAVQKCRAVIPLLPLTETPKEMEMPLDAANDVAYAAAFADPVCIQRHLKRAVIGAAQTPQAFAFPEILAAHQKALAQEFTDDAEVWAAFCGPVAAIPGEPENRKITFPEDL